MPPHGGMAANGHSYESQRLLLPDALQEWLPEGHLAHFMSNTIEDLQNFP